MKRLIAVILLTAASVGGDTSPVEAARPTPPPPHLTLIDSDPVWGQTIHFDADPGPLKGNEEAWIWLQCFDFQGTFIINEMRQLPDTTFVLPPAPNFPWWPVGSSDDGVCLARLGVWNNRTFVGFVAEIIFTVT